MSKTPGDSLVPTKELKEAMSKLMSPKLQDIVFNVFSEDYKDFLSGKGNSYARQFFTDGILEDPNTMLKNIFERAGRFQFPVEVISKLMPSRFTENGPIVVTNNKYSSYIRKCFNICFGDLTGLGIDDPKAISHNRNDIRNYWLKLSDKDRFKIIFEEKQKITKLLSNRQKVGCPCPPCYKRRSIVEKEINILFDSFYESVEEFTSFFKLKGYDPSSGLIQYESRLGRFKYCSELSKTNIYRSGFFYIANCLLLHDEKGFLAWFEHMINSSFSDDCCDPGLCEMSIDDLNEYLEHECSDIHCKNCSEEILEDDLKGYQIFQVIAAEAFSQRIEGFLDENKAVEKQNQILLDIEEKEKEKKLREKAKEETKQRKKEKKKQQKEKKEKEKSEKELKKMLLKQKIICEQNENVKPISEISSLSLNNSIINSVETISNLCLEKFQDLLNEMKKFEKEIRKDEEEFILNNDEKSLISKTLKVDESFPPGLIGEKSGSSGVFNVFQGLQSPIQKWGNNSDSSDDSSDKNKSSLFSSSLFDF